MVGIVLWVGVVGGALGGVGVRVGLAVGVVGGVDSCGHSWG